MPLLGYKRNTDPKHNKRCLELWIEKGSARRAADELGVSVPVVVKNGWKYLLYNPELARDLLNKESLDSELYKYRNLTDSEFMQIMTEKAIAYFPVNTFNLWCVDNEIWKYPECMEKYRVKYPLWYELHKKLSNLTKVS
jgi:hypothetical protein